MSCQEQQSLKHVMSKTFTCVNERTDSIAPRFLAVEIQDLLPVAAA